MRTLRGSPCYPKTHNPEGKRPKCGDPKIRGTCFFFSEILRSSTFWWIFASPHPETYISYEVTPRPRAEFVFSWHGGCINRHSRALKANKNRLYIFQTNNLYTLRILRKYHSFDCIKHVPCIKHCIIVLIPWVFSSTKQTIDTYQVFFIQPLPLVGGQPHFKVPLERIIMEPWSGFSEVENLRKYPPVN